MPPTSPRKTKGKSSPPPPEQVAAFMAALDHPFKPEILALRQVILGAAPSIREGIKWNSLSFRTVEYFAAFNLRAQGRLQIILPLGARKRDNSTAVEIDDPANLLEWLASDRASISFSGQADINARQTAFEQVFRQWVRHLDGSPS